MNDNSKRTLYWDHAGPLMAYGRGMLLVANLNPQVETKWRMSRWEMFRTGLRFLRAAIANR